MKIKNIICTFTALQLCYLLILPFQAAGEQTRYKNNEQQVTVISVDKLSPEEKEWFAKFQEGSLFVQGWKGITADILAKTPEDLQEEQRLALETLGTKIGCEWSKDNEIRKIDTDMLKQWGKQLKQTAGQNPGQLPEIIAEINQVVAVLLN
ncbi:MAG: hypothetical protein JRF04_03845 [Deltaproteobacteria bacterium]|jgi:hypothetical protein|nr:hypothetical protein [Deltaproteobacteria bacterium]